MPRASVRARLGRQALVASERRLRRRRRALRPASCCLSPVLLAAGFTLVLPKTFSGENSIKDDYNAIHVADTPCTDALRAVPGRFRTIRAHGTAVGLPSDDDMGNSEVRRPRFHGGRLWGGGGWQRLAVVRQHGLPLLLP